MTELAVETKSPPPQQGVKQGLPTMDLAAAEDAAGKLWAVARLGTVTQEAFARQFGESAKASGGAWSTKMALLRGYKVLRFEDKLVGLSDLGRQIVNSSDPLAQSAARRSAVMNLKAYRELVEAFDGTPLPEESALAAKLEFEYGKTEVFARRAAAAFVQSMRHAQMLDAGDVVRATGGGEAAASQAAAGPKFAPAAVAAFVVADGLDESDADIDTDTDTDTDDRDHGGEAPLVPQPARREAHADRGDVSVSVALDLSSFAADDVIRILGALDLAHAGD